MPVVDIDSHFYEPFDWYQKRFPELAAELPPLDPVTLIATTGFGDVLGSLPPRALPADPIDRLPAPLRDMYRQADEAGRARMVQFAIDQIQGMAGAWKASDRVAYLDAQGIDQQLILPTFAFTPIAVARRTRPAETARRMHAYNTWTCETVAGHTDRLIPVGIVDFETMDEPALRAELTRLRRAGSRSFVFWPTPARGKSLAHPDYEAVWAHAAEIGMIPMVHVGGGRPGLDDAWLDNGRPFPMSLASYLLQLHQLPEVFLTEMIVNGVLERLPQLRVFVCELGVDWLPEWMGRLDRLRNFGERMGGTRWPYPLKPSEYVRRQVRVSPLEFDPVAETIQHVGPGIVVFASDYPHPEGGKNAAARFREELGGTLDAKAQEIFFGGGAAEALAVAA
jgi:predicted TIM-barrel fold metal-dependent hydrolase